MIPDKPTTSERVELVTFFYLLARDAIPAGEMARLVREAKRAAGKDPVFTSAPLAQLARELLGELLS